MQIDVWVLRKKRTKDELSMNPHSGVPLVTTDRGLANFFKNNICTDSMVVPATLRIDLK